MVQSDDFSDEKSLRKDQIEHAKMIYERNKEIYKYTFESMKFLDSKLTRAMTLITFMFTVQTGFITLIVARLESGLSKNLLILIAVITFALLMLAMKKALDVSKPKEGFIISTSSKKSSNDMQSFGETLQRYVDISHALATANEAEESRNFQHANELKNVHTKLLITYLLVCSSAIFVCLSSLKQL